MKVLVDTNVVLDLLLDRAPWSSPATQLFSRAETGRLEACLGATTVTTIHYLAAKRVGAGRAAIAVRRLLSLCSVAPVDRAVLEAALSVSFEDFEDAVLHEAARRSGTDAIVTRNLRDFRRALLPVLSPEECLRILESEPGR